MGKIALILAMLAIPAMLLGCLTSSAATDIYTPEEATYPFTIVQLPDTQRYTANQPEILTSQVEWVNESREALNVEYVSQVGDIVHHYDESYEWERAEYAFEGLECINWAVVPGNHDVGEVEEIRCELRYYHEYITPKMFESNRKFVESYPSRTMDNSLFYINEDYMGLNLFYHEEGFKDRQNWADKILREYADKKFVVTVHVYMRGDGEAIIVTRDNDTWREFFDRYSNIVLVLAGHIADTDLRAREALDGHTYYESLVGHDIPPCYGDGWLRYFEIDEEGLVKAYTYSPWLNKFNDDVYKEFKIEVSR